jgi:hypothetical protein
VDQPGVHVTMQDMYALLLRVDATVTKLALTHQAQEIKIVDHETRLRSLESIRSIDDMDEDIKSMRTEIEGLKRIVWALPSTGLLLSAIAIIITIVRTSA